MWIERLHLIGLFSSPWLTRLLLLVQLSKLGRGGAAKLWQLLWELWSHDYKYPPMTNELRSKRKQKWEQLPQQNECKCYVGVTFAYLGVPELRSPPGEPSLQRHTSVKQWGTPAQKEGWFMAANTICSLQAISAASGGRNLKYLFLEHIKKISWYDRSSDTEIRTPPCGCYDSTAF